MIERMQELQLKEGAKLGEMAVLYRTNTQSRVFEEMLIKSGMAYTMVGGTKFYERKEIKDIIAYLRLIYNPHDGLSLERIINVPRRGIGDATWARLQGYANETNQSMFDVISNASEVPGLSSRFVVKLDELASLLFEFMGEAEETSVKQLIINVMQRTGYQEELELGRNAQDQSRLENLQELLSVAEDFAEKAARNGDEASLENFLSEVALVSDIDDAELGDEAVTLMTLHSAKGLEFPTVFLVGMEEGIFPHARTLLDEEEIEEERRICYVGITRAERRLYLSNAKMRMIYGHTLSYPPSRFLQEVPRNLIHEYRRPQQQKVVLRDVPMEQDSRPRTTNWFLQNKSSFVPKEAGNSASFKAGDRVNHKKWGMGTIVAVKDTEDGQEVKVAFNGGGIRSLLTKYAVLQKV